MKKTLCFALLILGLTSNLRAEMEFERETRMDVLSWKPRIFYFHNFLSDSECEHLKVLAAPYLERSTVVGDTLENGVIDNRRTSQTMFLPSDLHDPIVKNIETRISRITLIPLENCESIQVVYYDKGGEYQPHYDYFDPNTQGGMANIMRGGQRVATFLMYLNDVEKGGQTIFPKINLAVTPKRGDAILFFDCLPDGRTDPLTFHGGSPVLEGEKWIATKWFRTGKFK